ncbi:MAG: signal peptidase I [Hyphomicrobiaceae bacterium]|nr:signal peptidase I [Hyphomicrobiaceae bacterium]MCC0007134.1 signal peptidase I [Hyphomicrobiaceae bacterium]
MKDMVYSIVAALALAFAFQTAAYATYHIPSESMVPTLEVGDRLTVNKFAYGYSRHSLPLDMSLPENVFKGRVLAGEPERGDIIVFVHPKRTDRMIKRLIGMPGDRIAVENGNVILNGKPLERTLESTYRFREHEGRVVEVNRYKETLPGGRSYPTLEYTHRVRHGSMAETTVPAGHYFMMGDNRDNSNDSRFADMGLVPAENLVGRADAVLYSFYSCAPEPGTHCAERRFATRLR